MAEKPPLHYINDLSVLVAVPEPTDVDELKKKIKTALEALGLKAEVMRVRDSYYDNIPRPVDSWK